MGISVFPAASGGATVSDGNAAGWNSGAEIIELISEYTSTTFVSSITISSIPQTYRKLIIQWNGLEPSAGLSARLRMNGDNVGHAESGITTSGTSADNFNHTTSNNGFFIGTTPAAASVMNGRIEIENYTSTAAKIGKGFASYFNTSVYGATLTKEFMSLVYRTGSTTPAITSMVFLADSGQIGISGALSQGIRIYGVK